MGIRIIMIVAFVMISIVAFSNISNFYWIRSSEGEMISAYTPKQNTSPVFGHDIFWYDFSSGQILTDEPHHKVSTNPVIIQAKETGISYQTIKFPTNADRVAWEAPALLFNSDLNPLLTNLTLISSEIIFDARIRLSTTGNTDGAIILEPKGGIGFVSFKVVEIDNKPLDNHPDGISNKAFTFKERIDITNPEDRKKLIPYEG